MKYLLDTTICVEHLRRSRSSSLTARLRALPAGDVCLCSVVRAEPVYGAHHGQNAQTNLVSVEQFVSHFTSLPFDDRAADHYGAVRSFLATARTPIGANDLLIAGIALANNLILITRNTREFQRVPGLSLEDWSQP